MFRKFLLAATVVVGGVLAMPQAAEAHGPYGPYRSFGPGFRPSVGPVYRSARPVVVAPAPVYRTHRVYTPFPTYSYGYSVGGPHFQTYRPSVGVGAGHFGYPVYGPSLGTPRGFSFYFGP